MTTPAPAGVQVNGPEIRRRRQLTGHNLREMAAKAAITLQYLSQIERGTRRMSPGTFARLANALGVPENQRQQLVLDEAPVRQAVR